MAFDLNINWNLRSCFLNTTGKDHVRHGEFLYNKSMGPGFGVVLDDNYDNNGK